MSFARPSRNSLPHATERPAPEWRLKEWMTSRSLLSRGVAGSAVLAVLVTVAFGVMLVTVSDLRHSTNVQAQSRSINTATLGPSSRSSTNSRDEPAGLHRQRQRPLPYVLAPRARPRPRSDPESADPARAAAAAAASGRRTLDDDRALRPGVWNAADRDLPGSAGHCPFAGRDPGRPSPADRDPREVRAAPGR